MKTRRFISGITALLLAGTLGCREPPQNDHQPDYEDALEQLREMAEDSLEARTQAFLVTSRMLEVLPDHLDIGFYAPLIEKEASRIAFDALIDEAEKRVEAGKTTAPLLYYWAIINQESSAEFGWVTGNGILKLTDNKNYLKQYNISNRGACGPAQIIPQTGKELGLLVIEHESFNRGWGLRTRSMQATRDAEMARTDLREYELNLDLDNLTGSQHEIWLGLTREYQERQAMADSIMEEMELAFAEYEEIVADSVAGKTIEELESIDQRFTPRGMAKGIMAHDEKVCEAFRCDMLRMASNYSSGVSDEMQSPKPDYILMIRRRIIEYMEVLTDGRFSFRMESEVNP